MKSKGVAYLLWFFLGWAGIHRFYVGKIFTGLIWLCTFGLCGIGWFIDLFLVGGMVDMYNALHMGRMNMNNNQNINNINVTLASPTPAAPAAEPAKQTNA